MRIIEIPPKSTSYAENLSILIFLNASKQNITPKYGRDKGNCHHFVNTLLQKNSNCSVISVLVASLKSQSRAKRAPERPTLES